MEDDGSEPKQVGFSPFKAITRTAGLLPWRRHDGGGRAGGGGGGQEPRKQTWPAIGIAKPTSDAVNGTLLQRIHGISLIQVGSSSVVMRRVDSGVVRIDPLRLLAGCRTR